LTYSERELEYILIGYWYYLIVDQFKEEGKIQNIYGLFDLKYYTVFAFRKAKILLHYSNFLRKNGI